MTDRMLLTRKGPGRKAVDTRFWGFVERREAWVCWLWTGKINNMGYGLFRMTRDHTELAHRMAYRLSLKWPVEPEAVMHVCDEPLCCNPLHLVAGTRGKNIQDCINKGRAWWQKMEGA